MNDNHSYDDNDNGGDDDDDYQICQLVTIQARIQDFLKAGENKK